MLTKGLAGRLHDANFTKRFHPQTFLTNLCPASAHLHFKGAAADGLERQALLELPVPQLGRPARHTQLLTLLDLPVPAMKKERVQRLVAFSFCTRL